MGNNNGWIITLLVLLHAWDRGTYEQWRVGKWNKSDESCKLKGH